MKFLRLFFAFCLIILLICAISACSNECKHENMQITTTDPTCTENGQTVHSCPDCTYYYVSDIVNPLGHDYTENKVLPDCEHQGYTEYSCACGFSYVADVTDALGHNLILSDEVAADCENPGYKHYECSRCDLAYNTEFTQPTGHSITSETVLPTCTEEGYTVYSCTSCNYTYTSDHTAPLGHKYTSSSKEPTCTEEGYVTHTCECGDTYTLVISPLGHDFTLTKVAPTVSEMGYTEYYCESCEYSYIGNYVFYSDILDNAYSGSNTVAAKGIDISKWNHTVNPDGSYAPIDWVALKNAGFDYVILKIGSSIRTKADGTVTGGIEPTFEMDYEGAKAAGLDVGVYFFTYSTNVSGIKKDAELLTEWLDGKQFEYPIYLDLEDDPNASYYPSEIAAPILTEMCLTFFSDLQKEGYYTGLYVNNNFLFNILQTENMIELFEIWYARYPSNADYVWNDEDENTFIWNTEKYGETLGMWQYCCTGIFESISGKLDFNYAYKDYPSLIKYYGFNGYSAES